MPERSTLAEAHSRTQLAQADDKLQQTQAQHAAVAEQFTVDRMKFLVLQSQVIHTEDTSIKMLEPGRGTTRTCKSWPYLSDWLHPYAVYDFTLSRERDGPAKFLASFEGYLPAGAYSGYGGLFAAASVCTWKRANSPSSYRC